MIRVRAETFENAHSKCANILTAINSAEAALLYKYALECPDEKMILEVGSDKGFSTVLLAQTDRTIIAVDPHDAVTYHDPESGLSGEHTLQDYEAFKNNVEPYGNIVHIKDYSENVSSMLPVGFMFIDANHSWPHPKNDFLHFEEGIIPGSYVAWHDYISFPGVTRSIEQLIEEGKLEMVEYIHTLCITKVPNA